MAGHPSPGTAHARSRKAGLHGRAPDDLELLDAARNLRYEKLADHVRRVVAEAPPLTAEMRDRIGLLLAGGPA